MCAAPSDKPTLVFLPGTMCDARLFAPQIAHFRGAWDIQTPTISGHRDGVAGVAAALLSALPPRFALVGLSLGGIVALAMWRQAAARISHFALLNTNDAADTAAGRTKREADFARAQKDGLENFMRQEMLARYLHPKNRDRRDITDAVVAMAMSSGMTQWRGQLDLLPTREEARGLLPHIDVPLLIAGGEEDRICPPDLHRAMATAAGTTAKILSDCGHLSTLEVPAAVNESLEMLLFS